MRFSTPMLCVAALLLLISSAVAQETTGGLQGTVKDQSGAVVPKAQVTARGQSLVGDKQIETDGSGYFRFANLPPGDYNLTVSAKGFRTVKRDLTLEVGHLPTVDFTLEVGATAEVVEVSGEAPQIDVTTEHTLTNVTEDVIQQVPHGYSFQSRFSLLLGPATNRWPEGR
jgi:hypothetical protein